MLLKRPAGSAKAPRVHLLKSQVSQADVQRTAPGPGPATAPSPAALSPPGAAEAAMSTPTGMWACLNPRPNTSRSKGPHLSRRGCDARLHRQHRAIVPVHRCHSRQLLGADGADAVDIHVRRVYPPAYPQLRLRAHLAGCRRLLRPNDALLGRAQHADSPAGRALGGVAGVVDGHGRRHAGLLRL